MIKDRIELYHHFLLPTRHRFFCYCSVSQLTWVEFSETFLGLAKFKSILSQLCTFQLKLARTNKPRSALGRMNHEMNRRRGTKVNDTVASQLLRFMTVVNASYTFFLGGGGVPKGYTPVCTYASVFSPSAGNDPQLFETTLARLGQRPGVSRLDDRPLVHDNDPVKVHDHV